MDLAEKTLRLRRQHIVAAAIAVFAERGFHRATIREIAQAAGVADGTIYNSFDNKLALLLAVLDPFDDVSTPPDARLAIAIDDPESFVREMMRRRWAAFTPEALAALKAVFSELFVNEALRAQFAAKVIEPAVTLPAPVLARLIETGRLQAFAVDDALRAMTAAVLGFVMLRLLGDAATIARWDAIPDELAERFLAGRLPA